MPSIFFLLLSWNNIRYLENIPFIGKDKFIQFIYFFMYFFIYRFQLFNQLRND